MVNRYYRQCFHCEKICTELNFLFKYNYILLLFFDSGGWKKNWKGEWIKDEDVEFDSDEEPPDLP